MKVSKRYRFLVLFVLVALVAVLGCGGDDQTETVADTKPAEDTLPFARVLEKQFNQTLDRLRYGDRSGLWENEFPFLREEMTFDLYVQDRQIRFANADSLTFLEVRHVDKFDMDSAVCEVTFHFEGLSGKKHFADQEFTVYYYQGKWIKPTISSYAQQAHVDSLMQEAIKAAEREAEG